MCVCVCFTEHHCLCPPPHSLMDEHMKDDCIPESQAITITVHTTQYTLHGEREKEREREREREGEKKESNRLREQTKDQVFVAPTVGSKGRNLL